MSTTAIDKPQDLAELMRDKVRTELVKLIPDEAWDRLVSSEWDDFFKPQPRGHYSHDRPPMFTELVQGMIREMVKERVKPLLEGKLNQLCWENTSSEMLNELMKGSSKHVLQAFTEGLVRQVADAIQRNLHSGF
jgi:hypothetical protein